MPAPAKATRRATPKQSPAQNIGRELEPNTSNKSLGIYDTSSVKDRIGKWQSLTVPDAPSQEVVDSTPATKSLDIRGTASGEPLLPGPYATSPRKPRIPQDSPKKTAPEIDGDKSPFEPKPTTKAATPRRRLVSDGHWKSAKLSSPEKKSPAKATPPIDIPQPRQDAWVRPKTTPAKVNNAGPPAKPRSPAKADDPKTPLSSPAPIRSLEKMNQSTNKIDLAQVSGPELPKDQQQTLGPLNAKNLRGLSREPRDVREAERERRAQYHPALEYFAGKPISDPPPQQPKQPSPPKKPADIRPTLEFFAGRIKPKGREDGGAHNDKEKQEMTLAKPPANDQPKTQTEPLGRVEAWLGDSTDPFMTKPSDRKIKSSWENEASPGPFHERNAEAEEEHRRRRERRKMAHRHDRDGNQKRADPKKVEDDDLTPWSATKSQEDSASESPASSLKRRGAKRAQHSPRSPIDYHSPQRSSEPRASSPPETLMSGLNTIGPDDSASMMLSRPGYPPVRREHASPTRTGTFQSSPTKQRVVKSTALVLGSPVPMQNLSGQPDPGFGSKSSGQPLKKRSTKRRKLTSHGDLISVLSEAAPASGSLVSACSIKSARSKPGEASILDLMDELKRDEEKYVRELHTLIDGVIPVLLTTVLAKDDRADSANSMPFSNALPNITAPIIDMGVALERLRSVHKRMPLDNSDAMMFWGPQAHRVYTDYIKTWRLGFENVIVNLASATMGDAQIKNDPSHEAGSRIDVAYLLKRPLVRVKYLSKTFKGISLAKNSSAAEELSSKYHGLVEAARARQQEEKGRLEDEAAAAIDASRARDPQSLAPLAGVRIDPHKCVRARDFFDLRLLHSSGQRLDCRVELILRDDIDKRYPGDVLICEVDHAARWLLLPPVKLDCASARHGDSPGEIVTLIRSSQYSTNIWHELVSLHAQDAQTASDWIAMLGTVPMPPSVPPPVAPAPLMPQRTPETRLLSGSPSQAFSLPCEGNSFQNPGLSEVHVPLGEQASVLSRQWESPSSSEAGKAKATGRPTADERASGSPALQRPASHSRPVSSLSASRSSLRPSSVRPSSFVDTRTSANPLPPSAASMPSERVIDTVSGIHVAHGTRNVADYDRMRRFAKGESLSEVNSLPRPSHKHSASTESISDRGITSWLPWKASKVKRNGFSDATSFMPSEEDYSRQPRPKSESTLFKGNSKIITPQSLTPPIALPSSARTSSKPAFSSKISTSPTSGTSSSTNDPPKTPQKRQAYMPPSKGHTDNLSSPPRAHSNHSTGNAAALKSTTQFTPPSPGLTWQRRSSSPLKHEYEPSTASDENSLDGRRETDGEDDAESVSSASSAEDIVPSLPPVNLFTRRSKPPHSGFSPQNPGTVAPSQSASQSASQPISEANAGAERKIASIFCWSDKGVWEPLHPDECSIVVSPGLIEAYEMSALHSGASRSDPLVEVSPYFSLRPEGVSPLVGLELTPLVPLRRGTAIDISIRSPPTKESTVQTASSNIMFRSRNNMECEHLYNAINQARINNPTYIAMQNARPGPESNWAAYMDSRSSDRIPWWRLGRRKSSYRAGSSRRTPSVAAQTHDSVGSVATMTSALSALRRFTAGSKMFNVAKSTVTHGSGPVQSMFSRSSGATSSSGALGSEQGRSGASTPPAGVGVGLGGGAVAALGIKGAKIRLYSREAAARWRDMGAAKLTVMQPARPAGAPPPISKDGRLEQEKRVVVEGGGKGRILLDVTLGESAFERVARTGIALSVWERIEEVRNRGGVGGVRVKVYMLQMKSEAEAAYMFSLVGRMRY